MLFLSIVVILDASDIEKKKQVRTLMQCRMTDFYIYVHGYVRTRVWTNNVRPGPKGRPPWAPEVKGPLAEVHASTCTPNREAPLEQLYKLVSISTKKKAESCVYFR